MKKLDILCYFLIPFIYAMIASIVVMIITPLSALLERKWPSFHEFLRAELFICGTIYLSVFLCYLYENL